MRDANPRGAGLPRATLIVIFVIRSIRPRFICCAVIVLQICSHILRALVLYRELVPCRIFHRHEQDHCCAWKASLYKCTNRSEWGERCRQVGNLSFITRSQWGRNTEGESDREWVCVCVKYHDRVLFLAHSPSLPCS